MSKLRAWPVSRGLVTFLSNVGVESLGEEVEGNAERIYARGEAEDRDRQK